MAQRLRILTLATLFPNPARPNFGIFVARQTAGLAARADVTVFNPVGLPPFPLSRLARHRDLARLPATGEWQGLTVHRPRFASLPGLPAANAAAVARAALPLARELHERAPFDLIDAEFFWPDGPAAMIIARELNVPFTVKARGFDIHHWGGEPACRTLVLKAAREAAGLFAVSEALKADMVALGMAADTIRVHYTGLDHALFHLRDRAAEKAALGLSGPVIATVGALIPRKRQHLLIEALPALPDATLVVIGEGPLRGELEQRAERLGVADRVRFAGALAHGDIAHHLGASDIMALVSSGEGLANAWVEALACGTPVIAADVGGVRELIREENAGRIVPPDPAAIAEAARAILTSPPARESVASAVAHMSWEANARQLESHFRQILDR